jgi:Protein of unknown function (DUF1254)
VSQVGRSAYLWGWPMMNVHNRNVTFAKVPEPGYLGGIVPVAPPNQLAMLRDYIVPEERVVACPNQDVVYGFGLMDFSKESAVVIQVQTSATDSGCIRSSISGRIPSRKWARCTAQSPASIYLQDRRGTGRCHLALTECFMPRQRSV